MLPRNLQINEKLRGAVLLASCYSLPASFQTWRSEHREGLRPHGVPAKPGLSLRPFHVPSTTEQERDNMKKESTKNPPADDDGMRSEYDFSGGIRGRYYRAMQSGYTVTMGEPISCAESATREDALSFFSRTEEPTPTYPALLLASRSSPLTVHYSLLTAHCSVLLNRRQGEVNMFRGVVAVFSSLEVPPLDFRGGEVLQKG